MNLNLVLVAGRISQDAELKSLPSGQSLAKFSVATSSTWVDKDGQKKESTEFHNLTIWGKRADSLTPYLKKGTLVFIEGTLRTSSWSGEDGKKRYRTEIMVNNLQFGPKSAGSFAKNDFDSTPSKSSKQDEDDSIPTIQAGEEIDEKDGLFIDDDDVDEDEIPF